MKITDEQQFNKILVHPRAYGFRSLFTEVQVTCDYPKEYEPMVKALSIRSRKKRIAFIYDGACERIDKYNEENGLMCSFKDSRCGDSDNPGRINGCCYRCKYQSSKGCPSKNLTCKFYFCPKMRKLGPLTAEDFPEFKILSLRQQYILKNNPYCTRESFLRALNIGSILLFFLYSTVKPLNMFIGERRNRKL